MIYVAKNTTDLQEHRIVINSETDARHWVINNLDLSKNWNIEKCPETGELDPPF